jgi:hypothetical protein
MPSQVSRANRHVHEQLLVVDGLVAGDGWFDGSHPSVMNGGGGSRGRFVLCEGPGAITPPGRRGDGEAFKSAVLGVNQG